jgi:hypothetical protein
MHRDSAHLGNSSLAAEKVDVLLKGADAGVREATPIDPDLTEQLVARLPRPPRASRSRVPAERRGPRLPVPRPGTSRPPPTP